MLGESHGFSGFAVKDISAAVAFYKDKLGLDVVQDDMGMSLNLAGGTRIFVYPKPDHQPASYTILNFAVADIDAAVDELTALGVSFEHYDAMPYQDEKGIARGSGANRGPDIAWFTDPSGNILSVLQDKPAS